MGLRLTDLGSSAMTWADFAAWLRYADHNTAVYQAVNTHSWSMETVLLANLHDLGMAQLYAFNRSKGGKMRKPKPFPRPKALAGVQQETKTVGKAAPVADIDAFLRRKNGR
jgi:hypothetical protein